MLDENELWVLSFYRTSEISGALFFGSLAKSMKPGSIQRDMTKHFSDEAMHAWHWSSCIEKLGAQALKLTEAYQDQYVAAAGMPVNLMEVLAITQVFEKRVINQYARHSRIPGILQEIKETLATIMADESWHIEWVQAALKGMEKEYGADLIAQTLKRFRQADEEVYQKTMEEHEARVLYLTDRYRAGGKK
jgi:hypothetical protein